MGGSVSTPKLASAGNAQTSSTPTWSMSWDQAVPTGYSSTAAAQTAHTTPDWMTGDWAQTNRGAKAGGGTLTAADLAPKNFDVSSLGALAQYFGGGAGGGQASAGGGGAGAKPARMSNYAGDRDWQSMMSQQGGFNTLGGNYNRFTGETDDTPISLLMKYYSGRST